MRRGLDDHGRAVAQDLGQAGHELGGVIVHGDDGIRAMLLCVLAHEAIGIRPGPLAQIGVDGDVACSPAARALL